MKKRLFAVIASLAILIRSASFTASAETVSVYEAENATVTGTMNVIDDTTASVGKVVGNFAEDTDSLTFTVDIPTDGTYNLVITSKVYGGGKLTIL